MGFLSYFIRSRRKTANVARERLSIIVAREGRTNGGPHYLPQLKQELLQVLAKYEKIDLEQVTVTVEKAGDTDVLELNVVLSPNQAVISPLLGEELTSWTPVPPAPRRPILRPLPVAHPAWWER
jgi:cell division topological specificity factor